MRMQQHEPGVHHEAIRELAEDDIDLLQARVAERLDVPCPVVADLIRCLVEVSLGQLDGRAVSPIPAGIDRNVIVPRRRLAERFLIDVLEMKSVAAHREAELRVDVSSSDVEMALDCSFDHSTTCPHGNTMPRSGHGPGPTVALSDVPVGERVHVEHTPDIDRITDESRSHGLASSARATPIGG